MNRQLFSIFKKYPRLITAISQKQDGSMKLSDNPLVMKQNLKNREKFLEKIGISPSSLVSARLTHSNKVKLVSNKNKGEIITGVDGLITGEKNLPLSITIADCPPIFLYDPQKEIIGLVHAGWRGLANNILVASIRKMIDNFDCAPEDILAAIGPSICQKHYEVGDEVAEGFKPFPRAIKRDNKKMFLDLKKTVQLQLFNLGLKKENTETSPECTYELPEKYFSYRRDLPRITYPLKNISAANSEKDKKPQQIAQGKPRETEAMMAVFGMKVIR